PTRNTCLVGTDMVLPRSAVIFCHSRSGNVRPAHVFLIFGYRCLVRRHLLHWRMAHVPDILLYVPDVPSLARYFLPLCTDRVLLGFGNLQGHNYACSTRHRDVLCIPAGHCEKDPAEVCGGPDDLRLGNLLNHDLYPPVFPPGSIPVDWYPIHGSHTPDSSAHIAVAGRPSVHRGVGILCHTTSGPRRSAVQPSPHCRNSA